MQLFIKIFLNGAEYQLAKQLTVTELLQQLSIDAQQIAVEKNAEIISRSTYDNVHICAGDAIELVEFVGGG